MSHCRTMTHMPTHTLARPQAKFADPHLTLTGERRARVAPVRLETLWFNTGTLCNLACAGCYIESSPTNDALVYLTASEVTRFLDEAAEMDLATVGFTGGEPFMNPEMPAMLADALGRGLDVLVLTNAMRPMQRPHVLDALRELKAAHGHRLALRVSLDHYTQGLHEEIRGPRSWAPAIAGLRLLAREGFALTVAGRTLSGEPEDAIRQGFAGLFADTGIGLDAMDPHALVLFPEMDETADVPEITTACWSKLGVAPQDQMCATSRMVIRRRGSRAATVAACTLITKDPQFELGESLREAWRPVSLNHPHCARFCVLGGATCTG